MKTPDQVLADALPEQGHHDKCECSECRKYRPVVDLRKLRQCLEEVKTHFEASHTATCNCAHCSSGRQWVKHIAEVLK